MTTFLNSRGGCLQKLQLYMQYSINVQSAVYFVIGFPFVRFLIISTILILNTEEVWENVEKGFLGFSCFSSIIDFIPHWAKWLKALGNNFSTELTKYTAIISS